MASETRKRLGVLTQQVAAMETKVPTAATADKSAKARAFLLGVGQLRTAVRAGRSFSNELQILTNLKFKETDLAGTVTDLLQTAEQGVPSLDQLRQEFAQLAGVIVQAGNLPKGKGLVDRTLARLAHSLKWRRTDDFNGVGVEAVVARAERALGQSDLAGAVTELKALTAAPALKVETWLKNAEALISVDTVLNRLQIKAVTLLTINE